MDKLINPKNENYGLRGLQYIVLDYWRVIELALGSKVTTKWKKSVNLLIFVALAVCLMGSVWGACDDSDNDGFGDCDTGSNTCNISNGCAYDGHDCDDSPATGANVHPPADGITITQDTTVCNGTFSVSDTGNGIFRMGASNKKIHCQGTVWNISGASAVAIDGLSYDGITVEGCHFEGFDMAIKPGSLGTDWTIRNNTFGSGEEAIYFWGTGVVRHTIEDNYFNGSFIMLGYGDDNIIRNNVFNQTGKLYGIWVYSGSAFNSIDDTLIEGNTFYKIARGIYLDRYVNDTLITRNKFLQTTISSLLIDSSVVRTNLWLNSFIDNANDNKLIDGSGSTIVGINGMGNYWQGLACTPGSDYFCSNSVTVDSSGTGGTDSDSNAYIGPWSEDCYIPDDENLLTEDVTLCRGTFYLPDTGNPGVFVPGIADVTLDCNGSRIYGKRVGGSYAISDNWGYPRFTVRNCSLGNYSYGVTNFHGSDDWKFVNSEIFGCSGGLFSLSGDRINITNSKLHSSPTAVIMWASNATIVGNEIYNVTTGIDEKFGNRYHFITGNNMSDISTGVLFSRTDNSLVSGNVIDCSPRTGSTTGIHLKGTPVDFCGGIDISYNTIKNCEIGLNMPGYFWQNYISRNRFESNQKWAVNIGKLKVLLVDNIAAFYWNTFYNNGNTKIQVNYSVNPGDIVSFTWFGAGNHWAYFDSDEEGCYDTNFDDKCDSSYGLGINGTEIDTAPLKYAFGCTIPADDRELKYSTKLCSGTTVLADGSDDGVLKPSCTN
ncbi:NosD domain-containing protein [Nanoarchaeota archaeon]